MFSRSKSKEKCTSTKFSLGKLCFFVELHWEQLGISFSSEVAEGAHSRPICVCLLLLANKDCLLFLLHSKRERERSDRERENEGFSSVAVLMNATLAFVAVSVPPPFFSSIPSSPPPPLLLSVKDLLARRVREKGGFPHHPSARKAEEGVGEGGRRRERKGLSHNVHPHVVLLNMQRRTAKYGQMQAPFEL